MTIITMLRAVAATALPLALVACATPAPIAAPAVITVHVLVVEKQGAVCRIRLPAKGNSCKGVGDADGLACGSPGEVIQWLPTGPNTTIRSISFPTGNKTVCKGGVTNIPNGQQCILGPQNLVSSRGVAFKYLIGVDDCDDFDPYVIVTRR